MLWNAADDPAGSPVTSYKIERKVNDGNFEVQVSNRAAGMTHWVDSQEPAADESRTYRVTSINAVGVGTEMAMVMIPYPMAGHTHVPPAFTAPTLTPTAGAGMVELSWTESPAAMDYTVAAIKQDLSSGFYWMPDITGTMHTVPNLDSGDAYYFVVAACKDAACTEYLWSNIVTATPN